MSLSLNRQEQSTGGSRCSLAGNRLEESAGRSLAAGHLDLDRNRLAFGHKLLVAHLGYRIHLVFAGNLADLGMLMKLLAVVHDRLLRMRLTLR